MKKYIILLLLIISIMLPTNAKTNKNSDCNFKNIVNDSKVNVDSIAISIKERKEQFGIDDDGKDFTDRSV